MPEALSALERIEIERACERLVYGYSRALDLGDMSAAADFFAENLERWCNGAELRNALRLG